MAFQPPRLPGNRQIFAVPWCRTAAVTNRAAPVGWPAVITVITVITVIAGITGITGDAGRPLLFRRPLFAL